MQSPRYSPATLEAWFTHQPASLQQEAEYKAVHDAARAFALYLNSILPADRPETDRAFEALELSVFWANAAIARRGTVG